MISSLVHLPGLGKSDHEVLKFEYKCYTKRVNNKHIARRNYFKGDYERIREDLRKTNWDKLSAKEGTIDESWEFFVDEIRKLIEAYIPVYKDTPRFNSRVPYINYVTKKKLTNKKKAWIRYLHCKTEANFINYKEKRNLATKAIREAKFTHEKDLARNINNNSKLFWKYVRENSKTKPMIGSLKDGFGSIITEDTDKANLLNNHFASVFKTDDNMDIPTIVPKTREKLDSFTITEAEVLNSLKELKANKAGGLDQIHPKLLIECKELLAKPLSIIFNKSLVTSSVPKSWKKSLVTPIFKSGDKLLPENYRPISISPICSNVMQKLVRNKIMNYLTTNNLITENQFGFLKGKSCQLQLLESLEDWTSALDSGSDVDIIFYDFKKAFDTLSHSKLLQKLESYGIIGHTKDWIENLLKDRSQEVVINNSHSSSKTVLSGVPQGSVLGPHFS